MIHFHSALIASPSLETFISVGNTGIELFALDERYPAIALVVVAEVMRIRQKHYCVAGYTLVQASTLFFYQLKDFYYLVPFMLITGPISGLIYWGIVGRTAGMRYERRPSPSP